jgi:AmiR/NasT family two-component response regulator
MPKRPIARVLLARLDTVMRSGLVEEFASDGIEVIGQEQSEEGIVFTASIATPDVIVIDGDSHDAPGLRARLRQVAPEAKLILLPRDEVWPSVLDPAAGRPRLIPPPVLDALRNEVRGSRQRPSEE